MTTIFPYFRFHFNNLVLPLLSFVYFLKNFYKKLKANFILILNSYFIKFKNYNKYLKY